ncbi:MAG: hypothetical protein F4124_02020 [Acidimicrobiia bacterium]|nr:hypothetical protein [bacterium]MXW57732.1 hypothetical protein [Acidimicrobiia bacterium]MDE0580810.1 hypothetical protein [bacterium]MDE0613848.1 hypothetical protein [bacterium]MXZ78593.1 hypothetical protein [Acidimicrobiia bacterium]
MRRSIALIAILALLFAACGNDDDSADEATPEPAAEEPAPISTPAPIEEPVEEEPVEEEPDPAPEVEPTPAPVEETTPVPVLTSEPVERPEPENFDDPAFTSDDKLSTVGLGSVYFGMTPDEAGDAVTTLWTGGPGEGTPRCYLLAPAGGPSGVVLTIYNSSIERIDITNPSITTRSGASVGSTEAQLHELFGERLVVSPYADGSGNSIQYVPVDEADVDYRVIWETDGTSVTSMRAGRLPAVAPGEPCT